MSLSSSRTSAWKPCVSRAPAGSGLGRGLCSDSMTPSAETPDFGLRKRAMLGITAGFSSTACLKGHLRLKATPVSRRLRGGLGGEAQQVPGGRQSGRAGQEQLGGGGNEGRGRGGDFDHRRRRHVATGAGDIIELVPQVQKHFHRERLYGAAARAGVRALTVADTTYRLAGVPGRA